MANHNWYIGQDIVCIKTHSKGVVKEGNVYTIKSLQSSTCNCQKVYIDVGNTHKYNNMQCGVCDTIFISNCIYWHSETLFAPLDTLTDISEIEEILNLPIEQLFKLLKTNNNEYINLRVHHPRKIRTDYRNCKEKRRKRI